MSISEDYKNLTGMIKDMDSSINTMSKMADSVIQGVYELPEGVKDAVKNMTDDEVTNLTYDKFNDLLTKNNHSIDDFKKTWMHLNPKKSEDDMIKDVSSMFASYRKTLEEINGFKATRDEAVSELKQATDNWFEYVNSEEYKSKKMAHLNELEEQAQNETDPLKKKKILKMLKTMKDAETLDFLFERFEKNPTKEARTIKDIYLNDSRRSDLIISKFKSRLPRFGYNAMMYKMFFNIEEKFLPEEYHDLNNIFLFCVMRYISFTDPYDAHDSKLVSSLLMKLYNLLYHKFQSNDNEVEFIKIVQRLDDYFKPFIDEFAKENITSPKHPRRIERQKEQEAKERCVIINRLIDNGIDPDTSLETEELRQQLYDVINKLNEPKDDVNTDTLENALDETESQSGGDEISVYEGNGVLSQVPEIPTHSIYHTDTDKSDTEPKVISTTLQNGAKLSVRCKNNMSKSVDTDEAEPNSVDTADIDTITETVPPAETEVLTEDISVHESSESVDIELETMSVDEFLGGETVLESPEVSQEEPSESTTPDRYYDVYDGFYMKMDNGKYGYYDGTAAGGDKRFDDVDYPEEDILRLLSTASVRKNEKFPK